MLIELILTCAMSGLDERPIAPPPRKKIPRPTDYIGVVIAVTKGSITIRGKDSCDTEGWEVIRTFKASEALQGGRQDPWDPSNSDYRLSDVKVGDRVIANLRAIGEDDHCLKISIRRRPGGLVPPAPFEPPGTLNPFHDLMNALQAHEERGVPLPPKYDPVYKRAVEEALQREHQLTRKREERIAPPPRPVIRK